MSVVLDHTGRPFTSRGLITPCPKCGRFPRHRSAPSARTSRDYRRLVPFWRMGLPAFNGSRLTRGGKRVTRGGKRITVASGQAASCECCEEQEPCVPCADINSATVRFFDLNLTCCVDLGTGGFAHTDAPLNDTDFVIPAFTEPGPPYPCYQFISLGDEMKIYGDPSCVGEEVDVPLEYDITLAYELASEQWLLTVMTVSGSHASFFARADAPLGEDGCLPQPAEFINQYTACNQNIEGTGPSIGFGGTASVVWA